MLFCIVGTSRCGSTLLRHLLHMHPEVNVFNETQWLPRMFEFFGTSPAPPQQLLAIAQKTEWDSGKNLIDVNLDLVGISRQDFFQAFAEETCERPLMTIQEFSSLFASLVFKQQNKPFWADKTPDYGYYMGIVQTLWPNCKFLHIKRLGHMAALSMSKHSGCQLMISAGYDNWCSLSYDGLYKKYHPIELPLEKYISSWCRRIVRIRDEAQRLQQGTYREFQFEHLVEKPTAILPEIASYLGLPASPAWVNEAKHKIITQKAKVATLPNVADKLQDWELKILQQEGCLAYLPS